MFINKFYSSTKPLLFLLLFTLGSWTVYSQEAKSNIPGIDTTYIQKFPDAITLRLQFDDHINSFKINDFGNGLKYTVAPNLNAKTSISFQFRSIDIAIGYTPTFLKFAKDEDVYGKTKVFNLAFKTVIGKWLQGLEYSRTKGYYSADLFKGTLKDEVVLFSDLKVTYIGGSTGYIINPNYSYRALTTQSEWQKKSAGSFVPGVLYYYTKFGGENKDATTSFDFVVTPAYFYNYVFANHFLLAAGATGGLGINHSTTKFPEDNFKESITSLSTSLQFTMGFGYHSKSFYTGVLANLQFNNHNDGRQSRLEDEQIFGQIYVGYRFDAPKLVLDTAQRVNTFLGVK